MDIEEMKRLVNKSAEQLDSVRHELGDDPAGDGEQLEAIAEQLRWMLVRWINATMEKSEIDVSDIPF